MSIILRDSRHAANLFGFTGTRLNSGTPRHKFQFFINIRFNGAAGGFVGGFLGRGAQDKVSALVKNVQMPGLNVNTETLNQYNRRKIIQTKIEPQNVGLTFHDTVDGKTLNLWEMYYEYYFKDGVASRKLGGAGVSMARFPHDTVKPRFEDDFGYNLERVRNTRQLINAIEIFQVHAGKFCQTTLVAPTITSFTHDQLDYADTTGLMEFRLDVMPEAIVYNNINQSLRSLGSDFVDRYRQGDFWAMSDILGTIPTNTPGRVLNDPAPIAPSGATMPQSSGLVSQAQQSRNVASVQQGLGELRDSIPGAVSSPTSTSVFGGKFASATTATRTLASTLNREAPGPSAPPTRSPAQVVVDTSASTMGISFETL